MMSLGHRETGLFGLFVVVIAFIFSGCATPYVASERADIPIDAKDLLVLPFRDMSRVYGPGEQVRCSLCGKVFTTGSVAEGAAEYLDEQLISLLQDQKGFAIITSDGGEGIFSRAPAEENKETSELKIIQEAGKATNADAVLVGHLYRFRERVGSRFAVESPASVAFELDLIRTSDGQMLWTGSYDETQQPLFDNLFRLGDFLERGMKWITAREMAAFGLKELLGRFPQP